MDALFFLFASFGAMLCWGIGDFLIQKSVRRIGDLESLAFIGLVGFVCLTPFIIGDLALLFAPENLGVLLVLGLLNFFAGVFVLEGFKRGKLSVVEVVLEFELPITIVMGFFLFAEFPNFFQFVLIVPIFIGILLISLKKGASIRRHHFLEKGVLLALVGAVLLGLVNSFTAFGARSISPLLAIWFPWMVVFVISLVVIFSRSEVKKTFRNAFRFKWLVIAMGIMDTAAWVFYAFSLGGLSIGVVTAITECYPVLGILFGIFLNRERIDWHQIVGVVLTIGAGIGLAVTLL